MRKQKVTNQKAADITVFYDEKDPQQYLVYDLQYGDTVIGSNSEKSQLALRFASELDDAHAKISIEGEDYSIEDLGSQKGTFKIKSDNSLIRLKPFKSYDLSPQMAFYLGRFKCVFRAVKSGRAAGLFSLSPLDGNSQKGKNQVQRQMSLEDDIEEDEVSRRTKKSIMQKLSKNQQESELIDDEVERKAVVSKIVQNKSIEQKSDVQSQKKFVKSKGQLPKVQEEQAKDKDGIQLNKSFLERIQERLKNQQQKDAANDIGNKNNSQKKKNQEMKITVKEEAKVDQMEEEEVWKPMKMKTQKKENEESDKKNKKLIKAEDKNQCKIDKIIEDMIGNNVDQKILKAKEQIKKEKGLTNKKVDKKLEAEGEDDVDKIKEVNGIAKGKRQINTNKKNIVKGTQEVKVEKGLSKDLSEKKIASKKQAKDEEVIKEVNSKKAGKIEKKEEITIDTKKQGAGKKAAQKEEQAEVKQKKGKAKKEQQNVIENIEEEEMILEKKSTQVEKRKKAAQKGELDEEIPKKSVGKQKVEKIEAGKDVTKVSSSKKKPAVDLNVESKQSSTSKKDQAILLGKRKAGQNDIEEDIPKKKVKKQEKENEPSGKSKNDLKKDQKKVKDNKKNVKVSSSNSGAKRELAQLNSEGNVIEDGVRRRDKLRVLFSNSCVEETEKEKFKQLGVQIVNDFQSADDFDILVTDQISRRVKILIAINTATPIVYSAWVKDSIKQKTALPFEPYIIFKASKDLLKQYSFTLSESKMKQREYPHGVLYPVVFALHYPLGNITKEEFKKLIESAGAFFTDLRSKDTYSVVELSRTEQNQELLKLGYKLVSEEGVLQSCLLQTNVLDDYILSKAPASSNKKKTAKK